MNVIGQGTFQPDMLRPAPRNANHMSEERYAALREGIRAEGFLQPLLVRPTSNRAEVEIIDGHHRARAAKEVGLESVPVVMVDCTDAEAARLAIGLNRRRGDLNLSEVSSIFADLLEGGVDPSLLAATGFSPEEVDMLVSAAAEVADEVPPSMDPAPEPADGPTKPWEITLEFADRREYDRARRGLRKAAGKGNELSAGLMRLLGEGGAA
jgi:ParB/RepB/Spo0J family partition protein